MKISQYIVVKEKGRGYGHLSRMTKESPALKAGEVAVKVTLELPDTIFQTPAFEANVIVPNDAVSKPVIEAEVIDNIQEIIKDNTGITVRLEAVLKDED